MWGGQRGASVKEEWLLSHISVVSCLAHAPPPQTILDQAEDEHSEPVTNILMLPHTLQDLVTTTMKPIHSCDMSALSSEFPLRQLLQVLARMSTCVYDYTTYYEQPITGLQHHYR